MKIKFLIVAASFLAITTLTNCGNDCAKEVCDEPPPPLFFFRIVNSGNKDLVVGPAKIYDTSILKITARRTSNSIIEAISREFFIIKNKQNSADSICTTGISIKIDYSVYYLSLNNVVTDSIYFGYNKRQNNCCDLSSFNFVKLNSFTIPNGGSTLPSSVAYSIIK